MIFALFLKTSSRKFHYLLLRRNITEDPWLQLMWTKSFVQLGLFVVAWHVVVDVGFLACWFCVRIPFGSLIIIVQDVYTSLRHIHHKQGVELELCYFSLH